MATQATIVARAGRLIGRPQTTVESFLAQWLKLCHARGLRPATVASYRVMIRLHVVPTLGAISLDRVGPSELNELYHRLLSFGRKDGSGGLSPRTVRYVHTIIRRAFADAVRLGDARVNPAALADPPSARAARAPVLPVWSPDELAQFLRAAEDDRFYPAFYLAATSGMRRGELLGLRWCDVDLDKRELRIVQTLIEVDHVPRLSPPKTERSRRTIAFDEKTASILLRHRTACDATSKVRLMNEDLVFLAPNGDLIHPGCFSMAFKRRVELAGVPHLRLHGLRHTHATMALRAGVHPKIVSERLGHASVGITLDTYSHYVPSLQREAAEAIAALLPD
jgi:integrase